MHKSVLVLFSFWAAPMALADVPQVATDIAPVHSLVAQVMGDLGTPALVVTPGASPHGYALRPSQAAALAEADLVVWMGPSLTPGLARSLDTLADGVPRLTLLDHAQTRVLEMRDQAVLDGTHDDHEDDHDGDHAHDDHDDDHDGDHAQDDHEDDHEDHDDHDDHDYGAGGVDPHAWLDPSNAALWLEAIAADLARIDPENAALYQANAAAARGDLARMEAAIAPRMAALAEARFVVFHDAYQYFETRFGLTALGAISLGDASDPGARRVALLRDAIAEQGVDCVFSEPQFNAGLVEAVLQGAPAQSAVIDPIGTDLAPGPAFYGHLISGVADSFETCLGGA